ncbi:cytochrome P450 [Nocardia sp. NPDC050406]|uniref:cytochrome P450 n=1 Tax=Nocardia sp. NPDC050406 TaxID=3364318 RepID=UPI00379B86DD
MESESNRGVCPIRHVVTEVGDDAWLVTGHTAVRQMFADLRLGRSHPTPDTAPRRSSSVLFGGPLGNFETELEDMAWRRSLLTPLFSPTRIRALRPRLEALASRLVDDMVEHGAPVDFQTVFANQFPVLAICELMGVPGDERERFCEWSDAVLDERDGTRSRQARSDLFTYSQGLIQRKRRNPGDDVFSRLSEVEGIDDATVAGLGMVLLVAGQETTIKAIGSGLLTLLQHPAQWQKLVDGPELIPGAVEELLRVLNDIEFVRYPRSDLDIGGITVRAGDLVLLDMGSANRDPEVFPEADRFDVSRANGAHLSFGFGHRYCTGAPLARLELQVALRQLVTRLPTLRLAVDPDSLTTRGELVTKRLTSLPVAWS